VAGSTGSSTDDFAEAFSRLRMASEATSSIIPEISVVRTTPSMLVPQSCLIEVMTRAAHRQLDWSDAYFGLCLSQTEHLYLAKHAHRKFTAAEKHHLSGDNLRGCRQRVEGEMGGLKGLLVEVLDVARKTGAGVRMSLVYVNGKLELFERKAGTGKAGGKYILSKFVT
jgi:hypothetical protein